MAQKRRPVPVPPPPREAATPAAEPGDDRPADAIEHAPFIDDADAAAASPSHPDIVIREPTPRSEKLEIRRGLLIGLIGTIVVALVAIAFLVGRETGRTTDVAPAAAGGDPMPEEAAATIEPRRSTFPRYAPPPATPPAATTDIAPATPPTPAYRQPPPQASPAPAAPATGDSSQQEAIARYFLDVDALGSGAGTAADPEQMATAIVNDGAAGNWSSFDEIARNQRSNLMRLQRMTVPPEARAHHERTVSLMQASIDLMAKVKRGMEAGDAMALTALSSEAQAMQREAEAAERLGAALRSKYGIPTR